MGIDHDNHDLASGDNGENFTQLLTKYVTLATPRLFALCQDPWGEDPEGWVFAWGAALDDSAVLFSPNGKLIGTFNSADSALRILRRIKGLCLIWVDHTLCDQPDTIAA